MLACLITTTTVLGGSCMEVLNISISVTHVWLSDAVFRQDLSARHGPELMERDRRSRSPAAEASEL